MIFWLVLKLEISYRVIISLEGFWFLLRGSFEHYVFLHGQVFEFHFHNSSFALDTF
jgi:hypothetical protein